jgi:hypothetical protein
LFRHAYAGTVHFAQGRTVDRAYVASTHAMSREAMYVAMTRHRHIAQLFVDTSRFKVKNIDGLPNALMSLLNKQERRAALAAAQREARRQAFFEESLRPDSKVNASDFVVDLDTVIDGHPVLPPQPLSRFETIKRTTLRHMSARSEVGTGEAARFDKEAQPSGVSNRVYRTILTMVGRVREHSAASAGRFVPSFDLIGWQVFSEVFRSYLAAAFSPSQATQQQRELVGRDGLETSPSNDLREGPA